MEAVHEQSVSVTPHIARGTRRVPHKTVTGLSQVMAILEMPNKYSGQRPQRLDVTAFSRLTEPPSNRLTHARSAMTPETRIAGIQVDD